MRVSLSEFVADFLAGFFSDFLADSSAEFLVDFSADFLADFSADFPMDIAWNCRRIFLANLCESCIRFRQTKPKKGRFMNFSRGQI